MAEYKCVNYSDLCRLCASSNGPRTGIFSDEGRKRKMHTKIVDSLRISIHEADLLPKSVCSQCLKQVETQVEFRESVVRAQGMLESCLNSSSLKNGGMVYIRDETEKVHAPAVSVPVTSTVSTTVAALPTLHTLPVVPTQVKLVPSSSQPAMVTNQTMTPIIINSIPKSFSHAGASVNTTSSGVPSATIVAPNSDFLSSIIQAVGIHQADDHGNAPAQQHQQTHPQNSVAQYTITLDGQTIKTNQIRYKIQDGGQTYLANASSATKNETEQQAAYKQVDEFLKLKTPVKPTKREPTDNGSIEISPAKKPKVNHVIIKSPITSTPAKQTIFSGPVTMSGSPVSPIVASASIASSGTSTLVSTAPISTHTAAKPVSLQDIKIMPTNKCIVPVMMKSEPSNAEQQISITPLSNVQDGSAKTYMPNVHYIQMKMQAGPDGIMRLAPAQVQNVSITPQLLSQIGIQSLPPVQTQPPPPAPVSTTVQPQLQQTAPAMQPFTNYVTLVNKATPQTQTQTQPQTLPTASPAAPAPPVVTVSSVTAPPLSIPQAITTTVVQPSSQSVTAPTHPPHPPKQQRPPPVPPQRNTQPLPTQPPHRKQTVPRPPPPRSDPTRTAVANDSSGSESSSAAKSNAQSLAATQQMKAISALSVKQEPANQANSSLANVSFTACEVCKKTFRRKEHLMQHLKSHIGLRPFKCEESGCSKSFSRKEHLLRHIVSHTGKKMFNCDMCHKFFSRKDNLNKHRKTHQESSGVPTYSCVVCQKTFFAKSQLLKHKNSNCGNGDGSGAKPQVVAKKETTKAKVGNVAGTQRQSSVQPPVVRVQQTQQQPTQPAPQPQVPQAPQVQQIIQTSQSATVHQQQQQQQIFTIPAQIQSNGKQIIQQLQIAMPNSIAQTQPTTVQVISGGASSLSKGPIIKSVDGNTTTVFSIPTNFIIDSSQFMSQRDLIKLENVNAQ